MSLNWKEIDLVLSELDIVGAKIERIIQTSFDTIVISLYKSGSSTQLLVSTAQGACRLHRISAPPKKPSRSLRFQECLKSRLVGGRIEAIRQLGGDRIVRIDITVDEAQERPRDETVYKAIGPGARKSTLRRTEDAGRGYRLYARLWSGAGNVLLVDENDIIVDVLARRPKRGEVSGEVFRLDESLSTQAAAAARVFSIRDLPGDGSFNSRLEAFYATTVTGQNLEHLRELAREKLARKRRALEIRIAELERKTAEFRDSERWREIGDILMANPGAVFEGRFVRAEDFFRGGMLDIEIDPKLSIIENARMYYERNKKARSGLADVEDELESARQAVTSLEAELASLESSADPAVAVTALNRNLKSRTAKEKTSPGLHLEVSGWTLVIGRTAKENDELLRHYVRGSDIWLHARDWPGSYVFIKARLGKTVPLEILLDAGMLAIYYSKGRSNGGGDLYYTYVKYLRRAKDAPRGTVLPTQEKNLSVTIDEARLKRLRALMGSEEGKAD
jgi:predicted ribosome quality control (RQC) complex YloA/Tae2 family protein